MDLIGYATSTLHSAGPLIDTLISTLNEIGLASAFVTPDGRIDSFFGVPDPLPTFLQLTKTLQREHFEPFRKIGLPTARKALLNGRMHSDENAPAAGPGAWPANRPLLDLILDNMAWPT